MYTYTILPLSFITNEKGEIYMDVCAMNCHYRFYTLEDFLKSLSKMDFNMLNFGQDRCIFIWIIMGMIQLKI